MKPNELTREIIGAAIAVHRELGPGKPEAAYERALSHQLGLRGLTHQLQKPVAVVYKGTKLECGYRPDLLVAETVVLEVKSLELVIPVHRAQVLTYLKLGGLKLALLLNFNVATLKEGIERIVLGFEEGTASTAASNKSRAAAAATNIDPVLSSDQSSGDEEAERLG